MTDREFDAIVIGGGPAGAQCVLWLTKLGLKACLLEKAQIGGLQARSPYSNSWLAVVQATTLARKVAANIERNISEQGCTLFRTSCERIDHSTERNAFLVSTALGPLSARNVILTTGTSENTGGMESDRAVLGLVGAASMQCAGKDVAILGGGDAACEAYQIAIQKGAARVRVFARSIRARKDMWGAIAAKDKRVGDYSVIPVADRRWREIPGCGGDNLPPRGYGLESLRKSVLRAGSDVHDPILHAGTAGNL